MRTAGGAAGAGGDVAGVAEAVALGVAALVALAEGWARVAAPGQGGEVDALVGLDHQIGAVVRQQDLGDAKLERLEHEVDAAHPQLAHAGQLL